MTPAFLTSLPLSSRGRHAAINPACTPLSCGQGVRNPVTCTTASAVRTLTDVKVNFELTEQALCGYKPCCSQSTCEQGIQSTGLLKPCITCAESQLCAGRQAEQVEAAGGDVLPHGAGCDIEVRGPERIVQLRVDDVHLHIGRAMLLLLNKGLLCEPQPSASLPASAVLAVI